jgi:23S rRNA-/tRNA-specific pseudouridylate synthase
VYQQRISMKISTPYGVGLVTHVQPPVAMKLSELFKRVEFENFEFLLEIGSIYVDEKRVFTDLEVLPNSLVRIHRNPKRHPIKNIDWKSLIVENNEDFVVINKPYGVPTHPTVDNSRENVLWQLSQSLNHDLLITHRLDAETTGLLLFAKNKQFQNVFNYLISNKMVQKKYRALTLRKPEEKKYIHYIKPDKFVPKLVSAEPIEGWQTCELIVEKINDVTLPNGVAGFESIIQLITGRTHQIRAQFTGINCPLFGDVLYGDENSDYPLGLQSFLLKFNWTNQNKEFSFQL